MGATRNDIENWIEEVMNKQGIFKYKIDMAGSTVKGDGYLGLVNFVKVIVNNGKDKDKVYDLVIKSAKKGDELRKMTPIQECYFREIFMYTKVFPLLDEFQNENTIEDRFDSIAKCYGVCDKNGKEAIIVNNLKSQGFEVHNRTEPQNLNHVIFVFRNYARFHALSLAMKIKKASLFKALTKNMGDVFGMFMVKSNINLQMEKDFDNAVKIFRKYNDSATAKKFEVIKNNIKDIVTNLGNSTNPASVIIHGDCWNNNMMFKYEGKNKIQPVEMRFIDFQLSKISSPILDLSYYLYTCADKAVLQNFDFLLQLYYSSLSDYLEKFGVFIENVITFKELKEQWKIYGQFGLTICPMLVKVSLCESDEAIDLTDAAKDGNLGNILDFEIKNKDLYEERMRDVFEHWAKNFLPN